MSDRRALLLRSVVLTGAALTALAYVRVRIERKQTRPRIHVPDGPPPRDASGAPGMLDDMPRPAARRSNTAARVLPPPWEPAALTALASWEPAPPRSPALRALAYLWASPMTLLGLVGGALSGTLPSVHEGALVFDDARGPVAAYLRARGFAACTLGHVIIATGTPSPSLLVHELVHTRQAERLGPLMGPVYLGLLAVYGYARHPLERAARRVQRRETQAA